MSNKYPCRPGAKRRLLIEIIISVVVIIGFEVVLCSLGFADWNNAPRIIFRLLIVDALVFVLLWYFGDL